MRTLALTIAIVFTLTAAWAAADASLWDFAAGPHGPALELPSAHFAEAVFTLPDSAPGPVRLYLQAIMRYRALSHTAGVLRIEVNGKPLTAEHAVNKVEEWRPTPQGPYAGRAWALPAQPAFASGERPDLGGLGYLFDVTPLVRPGRNTLRITHAAATDIVLLRDLTLLLGDERIAIDLAGPRVQENDPAKLQWNFAPNILERRGLFLARGILQPVEFYVRNEDAAGATEIGLALELPTGVEIVTPYIACGDGWTDRIRIEERGTITRGGVELARYILRLPREAAVAGETDWHTFEGHPLTLYLRCSAPAGSYRLAWRSLSQGGEGLLMSAPLTVLPEPPDAPRPMRSLLGVWAYRTVREGTSDAEQQLRRRLREQTCAVLARLGVSRLVLSDSDEIPAVHRHGMLASLASPWSFNRTVYPTGTTDPALALHDEAGAPVFSDRRTGEMQWCPTYAGRHGEEVFGLITERIREEGWDGFDLDHEGVHHQCFCQRCREAFAEREGVDVDAITWPDDVLPDGDLHEAWLRFHVWNGGRHVERIREAVKAGNPDAPLFSWFTMSLYEAEATGPHAEIYHERVREEREIGYDIAQFLPHLDYANMANGVYPHGEETWEEPFGLTWAFNRVEATVDNPWEVPLAPCLNFGGGATRSWTNFDYLRWQAKTHIAQGVRGLDFWMLPFFDGRHYTLLSELARVLSATEGIVWEGERSEDRLSVEPHPDVFWRAFESQGRLMLGMTNRSLEPVTVRVTPEAGVTAGRRVLTGEPVGARVTIPPLDGVFMVYRIQ